MSRFLHRRLHGEDREAGVYAVLYAVLVVVLVGLGAIVVDLASVRQDRRDNRAAADAAAVGGAYLLDTTSDAEFLPYDACRRAWKYLETNLSVTMPVNACSAFASYTTVAAAKAYCSAATPAEIDDDRTLGQRTVRVAWPVPRTGGSGLLNPELNPGSVTQTYAPGIDGPTTRPDNGCDRLGVVISQQQDFGLANALGYGSTTTQVHSVARIDPDYAPPDDVAALNVLNRTSCESLVTTGGGKVLVGPTLLRGTVVGPGVVAVEADGTANCSGGQTVIDPTTGSGSLICASLAPLTGPGTCDGKGIIQSHALDPGGVGARAYNTAAVPGSLTPRPTAEGGIHGYVPVTRRYGCEALTSCAAPTPNYIHQLVLAYGGTGAPTTVYSSAQAPYTNLYTGGWTTRSDLCPGGPGITSALPPVPAGNVYVPCTLKISNGGVVIFQGGNVVIDGSVSVAASGCLVVNSAVSSCPTGVTGSGSSVTSQVPPVADAIVYLRGNGCSNYCFDNAGTLVMPQTFMYSAGAGGLNQGSTGLTLWTAPGAGAEDGSGRTTLERACYDPVAAEVKTTCMESRFSRLTFWSEYAAPKTKPNQFAGQGALNVVGVFFTPRAYFNFTGGGSYTGAAAQFWADQLNVNGGANLGLSPDVRYSVPPDRPRVSLIR